MNNTLIVSLFFACLTHVYAIAQESAESEPAKESQPWIMDSATTSPIELDAMLDVMLRQNVIFLGEQHDNDAGHEFQLQVIQGLADRGANVVVSMEQFERDVQGVVNDYLAGRIDEEEFLKHSRPWKNYEKHYRPIVEFAKSKSLPVLAGNVPRRLAGDASKKRRIHKSDKVYLPRNTHVPRDEYWERFQESMKGHGGTGDGNNEMMMNFYTSQCLKDDAMAESITDYLDTNGHQPKVVVHLCGHFHSDYGFGTAIRVLQRRPLTGICVVTMDTIPDEGEPEIEKACARGHFVFWTVKNPPGN